MPYSPIVDGDVPKVFGGNPGTIRVRNLFNRQVELVSSLRSLQGDIYYRSAGVQLAVVIAPPLFVNSVTVL